MNSVNRQCKISINRIAVHAFLLALLTYLTILSPPTAFGVSPAPDGGYPNANTAEGTGALNNLNTNNGGGNTALGDFALQALTAGSNNTAVGAEALFSNTGEFNTAVGEGALQNNTSADFNTAVGDVALQSNTSGGGNTAIGASALQKNTGSQNTATGVSALANNAANNNTATGYQALTANTIGNSNTADGTAALARNNTGSSNTATGIAALFANVNGNNNTANGADALFNNTQGAENTAIGVNSLLSNTTGGDNTATGDGALESNIGGGNNTANGAFALFSNTNGAFNTANGDVALHNNTSGSSNTAVGIQALSKNIGGSDNTAVGALAGQNLTTGNNNIDIGANVLGVAGESSKIRIGKQGTQNGTFIAGIFGVAVSGSTVVVNSNGKLGVATSSARFKEAIKPMDKASEAILALKPVSFRYKEEVDPEGIPQFGLIAEEVAKVNSDLVGRDEDGKVSTVRYEAVNAMLLNEFLKEHRTVAELKDLTQKQQAMIAQQQKQIEALTATVQKVSDQVALR